MSKHTEWLRELGEELELGRWSQRTADKTYAAAAYIERLEEIIRASEQEPHDAFCAPGMDGEPWAMRGALRNIIARAAFAEPTEEEKS